MEPYQPNEIEPKWQARWEADGLYRAGALDAGRPRFYALDMFPYPSGDLRSSKGPEFTITPSCS